MMRSLFSGVSGLRNHQVKMDVIGNNIANVNTYGFKQGRVTFQDVISQTIQGASAPQGDRGGINPKQVGLGMKIASIDNIFNQGGLESTSNLTDLAIDGEGFFILRDGLSTHYTRAGTFTLDAAQTLVSSANGYAVQGWSDIIIDSSTGASRVDTSQPIGDLEIVQGQKLNARSTTSIRYACNLDSAALGQTAASVDDLAIELTNNAGINLNLSIGSQIRVDADASTPASFTTLTVANADGTAGDGQFATLSGLADEIESVLQSVSTTAQVSISSTGSLTISNPTGAGAAQLDVSITALDTGANPITNFNGVFSIANGVMNIDDNLATSTLRVANHQTSIITYDSLGTEHNLTVVFTKTSTDNVWNWEANLPTTDAAASTLAGNTGTLTFGANGLLISSTGGPMTFSPPGADPVSITPNFDGNGVLINGVTQFASDFTTAAKTRMVTPWECWKASISMSVVR